MKRAPFRSGRGRCIFCQREPPAVKISKEHVFGDWLRDIFPRDANTTHTLGAIDYPTGFSSHRRPIVTRIVGQGHSGSKKVKVVCKNCNETWLSNRVEDAAKPILIPMIAGRSGLLTEDMQAIVATWFAKTAMTAEHLRREYNAITQKERTWLMNNLTPPSGWFIRAAGYSGTQWSKLSIYQNTGKLEVPSVNDDAAEPHNLGLTLSVSAFVPFWSL